MPNYTRIFAEGHAYFITINTEKRRPILIDNITLLRQAFANSKQYFDYTIDCISIMPEHLHMVLVLKNADEYPKIIASMKRYFSENMEHTFQVTQSKSKKRELGVWQRRYYEHTIRDEKELERYRNYVHYNPVKHGLVKSAKAWEFSSFSKFVSNGFYDEDWYNLDDDLDLEYQS